MDNLKFQMEVEKFNKLPKWTRDYIGQMQYRMRELERQLDVVRKNNPKSGIAVRQSSTIISSDRHFMPEHSRVELTLHDHGWLDIGFDTQRVSKDGRMVNVYAHGGGELVIKPVASNLITLAVRS